MFKNNPKTKYFQSKDSKNWLINTSLGCYPHPYIRTSMSYVHQHVKEGRSHICTSQGLFNVGNRKSGFIGCYGGQEGRKNSYAMDIKGKVIIPI
jgi:hypothetical protein